MPTVFAAMTARPRLAAAAVAIGTLLAGGCGRSPLDLGSLDVGAGGDDSTTGSRCGTRDEDFFASVVLGYDPGASGNPPPAREDVVDPAAALGPPDYSTTPPLGTVSIGDGGTLTLGFGACAMVTGPGIDLMVFEAGVDEQVRLNVRPTPSTRDRLASPLLLLDEEGFITDPIVEIGPGEFDVDAVLFGSEVDGPLHFDAVRLRDVLGQGLDTVQTPGADVDAVGITDVTEGER